MFDKLRAYVAGKLEALRELLAEIFSMEKLRSFHPTIRQGIAMALVAAVLLAASLTLGVFGSSYGIDGPYDQLYPATSPTEASP